MTYFEKLYPEQQNFKITVERLTLKHFDPNIYQALQIASPWHPDHRAEATHAFSKVKLPIVFRLIIPNKLESLKDVSNSKLCPPTPKHFKCCCKTDYLWPNICEIAADIWDLCAAQHCWYLTMKQSKTIITWTFCKDANKIRKQSCGTSWLANCWLDIHLKANKVQLKLSLWHLCSCENAICF